MAMTKDPFITIPGPIGTVMTPEEERAAEIERLVAEQVEKQRASEVGRKTFARVPGQTADPNVTPEQFNIQRDIQGNYWNRIQRTEGGPLMIERLASEYTPFDQKRMQSLYRTRSEYATDPDLEEDDRQRAFDRIDAQISMVPKMPPIMREPTAQQKFDAAVVTHPDGKTKGTFDPKTGKFIPLESSKSRMELETERRKRKQTFLANIMKANDAAVENDEPPRSFESMNAEAEFQSQIEAGLVEPAGSVIPQADATWQVYKSQLDNEMNNEGRATEDQMIDLMERYVPEVMKIGKQSPSGMMQEISEAEAKQDFLQRWQKAIGDGDPIVAKMSSQTQRRMWSVGADTVDPQGAIRGSITEIDGLRRGEGTVTVHPDVPKELDIYWGSLGREDKKAIRAALEKGVPLVDIISDIRSELGLNP